MNYILFTGTGIIEGKISSDGKHLFVLSDKVRSYNRWHYNDIEVWKSKFKRKRLKIYTQVEMDRINAREWYTGEK